jgi:transposase
LIPTKGSLAFDGMSNVLSEQAKQQVVALGRLGWSLRRIEQETGVRRETASVYLKAAGIAVGPRGRPRRQVASAKPAISVATDSPAKPAISVATDPGPPNPAMDPSASLCEPFREAIELGLRQGRNAMGIWQDLVSQSGFAGRYGTVKRFVRRLRGGQIPEACAVINTGPGEEGQTDYGSGPMVRDPESGKYRRTRLFVMMLGYSRKAVRLLTFRSSSRIWAELHEKAFRRLGGAPRLVVLDNLREGVVQPDIYDPIVNPLFRDVMAHYGSRRSKNSVP